VFKDLQKRNGTLSSTWLKNNENGWQNLIGIIFILIYFLIFLRERVTALLESAVKNNLLDYQLLKAEDIQKNEQSIN
jgi:hypothetical protein